MKNVQTLIKRAIRARGKVTEETSMAARALVREKR
jgi:hypothetical protein